MHHTLIHEFHEHLLKRKDQPFLWEKRGGLYQNYAWKEVASRLNTLARWLIATPCGQSQQGRVLMIAPHRADVLIADLAAQTCGVPLTYAPHVWPADKLLLALRHSEHCILFAGTRDVVELWNAHQDTLPNITHVVAMEGVLTAGLPASDKLLTRKQVMDQGRTLPDRTTARLSSLGSEREIVVLMQPDGSFLRWSDKEIQALCARVLERVPTIGTQDRMLNAMPLAQPQSHWLLMYMPVLFGIETYYEEQCLGMETPNIDKAAPTLLVADGLLVEELRKQMLTALGDSNRIEEYGLDQVRELGRTYLKNAGGLGLIQKAKEAALKPVIIDRLRARLGGRLKVILLTQAEHMLQSGTEELFAGIGIRMVTPR